MISKCGEVSGTSKLHYKHLRLREVIALALILTFETEKRRHDGFGRHCRMWFGRWGLRSPGTDLTTGRYEEERRMKWDNSSHSAATSLWATTFIAPGCE